MPTGVYRGKPAMTAEEKKERKKQGREKNREQIAAYAKQYYAENKEKFKEYAANRVGEIRAASNRYYAENKEKAKQYYANNRDRLKKKQKQYREANRETLAVKKKQYRKDHPEVYRRKSAKRRAIQRNATVGDQAVIIAWEKTWRSKKTVICHWCRKRIKTSVAQVDHVVPLAKGGAHSVENFCVSCAACNCSKQATPPEVWNASLSQPLLFM